MIYENASFPHDLKDDIYKYLRKTFADEKRPEDTDAQFIYKIREKAFGPFKRRFWELAPEVRTRIGQDLERKFVFLFERLNVPRTAELVKKTVTPVAVLSSRAGRLGGNS